MTAEEIAEVPLFANLSEADLDRVAHLRRHPAQRRRVRRARGRRARAVRRAVRPDRGGQALRRRRAHARLAAARHDLRRGAARLCHALPGWLSRGRAVAGDARGAAPLLRHRVVGARGGREGRRPGARAHRRAAGHRDAAAQGAPPSTESAGIRPAARCAAFSRNQIVHDWLSPDTPDLSRAGPAAPAGVDCPVVRLPDGTRWQADDARAGRAPGPADAAPGTSTTR